MGKGGGDKEGERRDGDEGECEEGRGYKKKWQGRSGGGKERARRKAVDGVRI